MEYRATLLAVLLTLTGCATVVHDETNADAPICYDSQDMASVVVQLNEGRTTEALRTFHDLFHIEACGAIAANTPVLVTKTIKVSSDPTAARVAHIQAGDLTWYTTTDYLKLYAACSDKSQPSLIAECLARP